MNGGRNPTGAKKEFVGDFKNDGRECRPQGDPEEVRVHAPRGDACAASRGVFDRHRRVSAVLDLPDSSL
jgi:hypothetical protein